MAAAAVRLGEAVAGHEALGRAVALLGGVIVERGGFQPDSLPETLPRSGVEESERARILAASRSWPPVDAQWLGVAHQQALDALAARVSARSRRERGAFYTPRALVRHILERTVGPLLQACRPQELPVILDPACGCGAFLAEAAKFLLQERPNLGPEMIASALRGTDIDPGAAALCRLALWLEFGGGVGPGAFDGCVRVGDSLADEAWDGGCDAVVGNPPFLSQLAVRTARRADVADRLRDRFGSSLRSYTDPAALFLQLGAEVVRPGGRVGMVLPVSTLASRDAARVRERIGSLGALRSLWLDRDGVFDAGVRTVAVVFERDARPGPIERSVGSDFRPARAAHPPPTSNWGPAAAGLVGFPQVQLAAGSEIAALADVTAGFRDEYYAIVPEVVECPADQLPGGSAWLPVVPVGMIDAFMVRWGTRASKIGGRAWSRPAIRADSAGPVAEVIASQRRPKLLVATQTRIVEVAPDPTGDAIALTPVVIVTPRDARDLWRLGAALASPAVSAWVGLESFGTARSLVAIKPSAALLRRVPLPIETPAWDRAARAYRELCEDGPSESGLRAFAAVSNEAYGVEGAEGLMLTDWWIAQAGRR